ncbi:TonB-dependent receptor plug domain-containing protein, partial [Nostoc sp.]
MKPKQLSQILLLTSSVWLWCAMRAIAQEIPKSEIQSKPIASVLRKSRSIREIRQLSEIEIPNTSARMLVQSPAPTNLSAQESVIQVTGVEAKPTDKGVEVILQTTGGDKLQITNRSAENNFIADIPNAQLRLPNGDGFVFRSEKPVEGITEITVTNLDANTIRVTVTGETLLPTAELFDSDEGLIFALTPAATAMQPEPEQPTTSETPPEEPAAQSDEPIELIVTGQQDNYRVPNASSATRTDTPIRDIPQSIQVVPRKVFEDRVITNQLDIIRTVSGVSPATQSNAPGSSTSAISIRGFSSSSNRLRNGLREVVGRTTDGDLPNLERVEVLKGPASVLYGQGGIGGAINLVTKQPLRDPFYQIDFLAGSYDLYRPSIDLSGPLNDSRT